MLMLSKSDSIEFQKTNKTPEEYAHIPNEISDDIVFKIMPDIGLLSLKETKLTNGITTIGKPFITDGAYRIDLNTGAMKGHISDWLTGKDSEFVAMDGMILRDNDNKLYQPVDLLPLSKEEREETGKYSIYDGFSYPTDNTPNISELVVLREDIEKFEYSCIENDIEKSQVPIDLDDRILKTKTMSLLFESIQKAVSNYPIWKDKFDRETIQMSDIDTWLHASITSTKRDAEIVKKILIEIFNIKKTVG
ncbi:hypothetical protein CMT41_13440 [Colwellia sp. MT41]|uniref:hypothetical protein n=1 Tax=Colwellia sp. MT41 TaxID=58049 RepID=UPI0007177C79|nr:hypothetical protein [Colwellia sp. MT41]ALO35604.1 hypothetical protein CMT41_13440 [Colwellia sp. MT41]